MIDFPAQNDGIRECNVVSCFSIDCQVMMSCRIGNAGISNLFRKQGVIRKVKVRSDFWIIVQIVLPRALESILLKYSRREMEGAEGELFCDWLASLFDSTFASLKYRIHTRESSSRSIDLVLLLV
jgi:hypothetical protein